MSHIFAMSMKSSMLQWVPVGPKIYTLHSSCCCKNNKTANGGLLGVEKKRQKKQLIARGEFLLFLRYKRPGDSATTTPLTRQPQ